MKQTVTVDYIYASTVASAERYARIMGVEAGWKFLHSIAHIYGTKNAVVLVCDCASTRDDYERLTIELRIRDSAIIIQPYTKELV